MGNITQLPVYWPASVTASWGKTHQDKVHHALTLLDTIKQLAVVPVSEFNVAALVFDRDGNAYAGVNQEYVHAAMAQTVHAEQSALAHAWSRGAKGVTDVVVNYPPCGHCRQFMNELATAAQIKVHLPQMQNVSLHTLLPQDFGPQHLDITRRLLDGQEVVLQAIETVDDPLSQAAVAAAQRSYAPYSGAYAGVALQLEDGSLLSGSYAENAAYNPSLPPLQMALNQLHLRGLTATAVTEVVMARVAGHGQATHAQALWQMLRGDLAMRLIGLDGLSGVR